MAADEEAPAWRGAAARHDVLHAASAVPLWAPTALVVQSEDRLLWLWGSRAHRKGRLPLLLSPRAAPGRPPRLLPSASDLASLSTWVALVFSLGCVAWVVNGHYALYSVGAAAASSEEAAGRVAAIAALVGGSLFAVGSWLMFWEALNAPLTPGAAQPAAEPTAAGTAAKLQPVPGAPDTAGARDTAVRRPAAAPAPADAKAAPLAGSSSSSSSTAAGPRPPWRWVGLGPHDVGFTASLVQLAGATVFWVPCIFGVAAGPEGAANWRAWDGASWALQVAGASCFIASSVLLCLETQAAWWRPALHDIGWHVGWWNLVGAAGFWLSGLFGLFAYPAARLQVGGMAASTFWGSYSFLLGSLLQLLEAINQQPERLALPAVVQLQRRQYAARAAAAKGGAAGSAEGV